MKGHLYIEPAPETGRKKLEKRKFLFIDQGSDTVPYPVEEITPHGHGFLLKLEGINNYGEAEEFSGCLFLTEKSPGTETPENDFQALVGFNVSDKEHGLLGTILRVTEMPQQLMAEVLFNGKELFFPLNEDFLIAIDWKNKTMEVQLPEGLLDIYR